MIDVAHAKTPASVDLHPAERPLRRFIIGNRAALGSLAIFWLMLLTFFIANPVVLSLIHI